MGGVGWCGGVGGWGGGGGGGDSKGGGGGGGGGCGGVLLGRIKQVNQPLEDNQPLGNRTLAECSFACGFSLAVLLTLLAMLTLASASRLSFNFRSRTLPRSHATYSTATYSMQPCYRETPYGVALHLHFTALHCTALHCTALHCTAIQCNAVQCSAMQYNAMHALRVCFQAFRVSLCTGLTEGVICRAVDCLRHIKAKRTPASAVAA